MKVFHYCMLLVLMYSIGCQSSSTQVNSDSWPSIQEVESLIGQKIDQLPDFGVFAKVDTIMESEGVEWPAVSFFSEGKLIMVAEANWEDEEVVQRITILDRRILCEDIYVGQNLFKIRESLDTNQVPSPDGYLLFRAFNCKELVVSFDLSKEPYGSQLFFGQVPYNLLPDSLEVDALMITK